MRPAARSRRLRAVALLVWAVGLGTGSAGCAVLTHPSVGAVDPVTGAADQDALPRDAYTTFTGIIHVHTTYSHDAHGRYADVVRVANAQGLDYVITTEHNNLRALRDGWQGWHGTTLLAVGMEISAQDGHYLALNVHEEIDREHLTTQQVIDAVNRQGGFGFIAHPYFAKGRWRNWAVHGFTGIEAYNLSHDTLDENRARLVLWTLTSPAEPFYLSILTRPYDPLTKWDELIAQHGRVVGIGSADAHEFHLFGIKFAPYEDLFRLARTHVLVPSRDLTLERLYEALRGGHAYVSLGIIGRAEGFGFSADDGERILGIMGDEVAWQPGMFFTVRLPAPAALTLFKDGRPAGRLDGRLWRIPVDEPGVYRIEASRFNKPWIISNPIYVRPAVTRLDGPPSS